MHKTPQFFVLSSIYPVTGPAKLAKDQTLALTGKQSSSGWGTLPASFVASTSVYKALPLPLTDISYSNMGQAGIIIPMF